MGSDPSGSRSPSHMTVVRSRQIPRRLSLACLSMLIVGCANPAPYVQTRPSVQGGTTTRHQGTRAISHYPSRTVANRPVHRLNAITAALAALIGLASCAPELAPRPTASVATGTPSAAGTDRRSGTQPLVSPGGDAVGSMELRRGSADSITVSITIDDSGSPHPWGIVDQPTCAMPPPNHDSPYQFADIEEGRRIEEIEAGPFLSFPGDLVVLVLSAQASSVYGCARLGPPTALKVSGSPSATCSDDLEAGPSAPPGRIAFARDVLSDSEIFVMNEDGSDVRRLTTSLGLDIKPTWSPDGSHIAFRSQRDGNDEIYLMNRDGSCQRDLTDDPTDDRSPAWGPDGRSIAFDHFFNDSFQDVAIIDARTSQVRRVTSSSGEYPTWSPDGRRLAFASARDGDYDIFAIDADGGNEVRLTSSPGYDMYPAWSPDGEWILYENGVNGFDPTMEVHMMRPDGRDDRKVTSNKVNDRFPAWSSTGRLAWSRAGVIVVADSPDAGPVEVGQGQFPSWWP